MLHVVIATRNPHKFRELVALLRVAGIRWHSLAEYPRLAAIAETGNTYDANAIRKARAVARSTGTPAIADDSGIEVAALNGSPGVRSARFAGRHGNDRANNDKLLRLLAGHPMAKRAARYRCALALASPTRLIAVTHGVWAGRIARAARGHRGFGYDPIFLVPRLGKTVGELPAAMKQRLSHRARAARRMRRVLARIVVRCASGRIQRVPAASRSGQADG